MHIENKKTNVRILWVLVRPNLCGKVVLTSGTDLRIFRSRLEIFIIFIIVVFC